VLLSFFAAVAAVHQRSNLRAIVLGLPFIGAALHAFLPDLGTGLAQQLHTWPCSGAVTA
jgi:hypothetical protein